MIALLSLIVSGLVTMAPQLLGLFKGWMDVRREIELKKLEIELAKQNFQLQVTLKDIEASIREGESLRSHDAALSDAGFIVYQMATIDGVSILTVYTSLWDENTQVIFGGIMGFWFGSRGMEVYHTRQRRSR
jgi:hypothetical protein